MNTENPTPPAGTTQTPLTDALACDYDGFYPPDITPSGRFVDADECRKIELALAASKAREAELVKALEEALSMIEMATDMGDMRSDWDNDAEAFVKSQRSALQSHTAALQHTQNNNTQGAK